MTARNPPMARGSGRSAYPQGRRPAVPYTTRAPGRVCRVLGPVRLLDDGRTVNPTQRLTGESGGLSHPLRLLTRRSRRAEEGWNRADCHCCVRTLSKRHAHLPGRVVALHQSALRGAR